MFFKLLVQPFIDPILALEEKDSIDVPDSLEVQDTDVKDEDYIDDEPENDDSNDEDYREEEDNDADSDFETNELPISTDKVQITQNLSIFYVNKFS